LETAEKLGMASLRQKVMALEHEIANLDCLEARAGGDTQDSGKTAGTPVATPSHVATEPPALSAVLRKEGDYWTIAHGEAVFRLKDSLGLHYLAKLLGNPGREFLATDLLATSHGDWAQFSAASSRLSHERRDEAGSLDLRLDNAEPILDPQARTAYQRRLEQLRDELEEAQAYNDTERAGRVQAEIDFLGVELTKAVGLGGRTRKADSRVERARLSVTRAIKIAVRNISRNDDSLGRYLASTIKTGTFCSYSPDPHPPIRSKL
jgi:non-specific serine/threonine protein kinase